MKKNNNIVHECINWQCYLLSVLLGVTIDIVAWRKKLYQKLNLTIKLFKLLIIIIEGEFACKVPYDLTNRLLLLSIS